MKQVVGGSIAVILGLFGFSAFFPEFLTFLSGIIPILLLAGGGLVIYLQYEEVLDFGKPGETEPIEPDIVEVEPRTAPDKIEPLELESTEDEPIEEVVVEAEAEDADPVKENLDKSTDIPGLLGNTGSLVFHNSDCKYSKSKQCTMVFNSRDEAVQDGYKPCGTCKP